MARRRRRRQRGRGVGSLIRKYGPTAARLAATHGIPLARTGVANLMKTKRAKRVLAKYPVLGNLASRAVPAVLNRIEKRLRRTGGQKGGSMPYKFLTNFWPKI